MQDMSGGSIKDYDLLECIGSTGFGAVYRAFQATVGWEVALKIVPPVLARSGSKITLFPVMRLLSKKSGLVKAAKTSGEGTSKARLFLIIT